MNLSPEQVEAFNERLYRMKGLTLQKIADLALEMGIDISLEAARTYKDTTFAAYLEEIKEAGQFSDAVTDVAKAGLNLSDAAAVGLNRKIFKRSMEPDLKDKDLDKLSLALARLRIGDQRAKLLETRLAEAARKEADWNERREKAKAVVKDIQKKGGLTKEAREQIERALEGEAA